MRLALPAVMITVIGGCSALVDLRDLATDASSDVSTPADGGDAGEAGDTGSDVTQEACDQIPSAIPPNQCAPQTECSVDGGFGCVTSPQVCGGIYEQCAKSADCAAGLTCCFSGTFTLGCPGKMLTEQGTSCQPACNTGSYRVCTSSVDCAPATCVPVEFNAPFAFVAGMCF